MSISLIIAIYLGIMLVLLILSTIEFTKEPLLPEPDLLDFLNSEEIAELVKAKSLELSKKLTSDILEQEAEYVVNPIHLYYLPEVDVIEEVTDMDLWDRMSFDVPEKLNWGFIDGYYIGDL